MPRGKRATAGTAEYRFKGAWRRATRQEVFARHGARCVVCGYPGVDGQGKGLILGHVVPHALGGGDGVDNLVPLCNHHSGKLDGGRRYVR